MYKLSPSDFKYLWEECPHCFWQKIHQGIRQPSIMPSIFTKISGILQTFVVGKSTQTLVPNMPRGTIISQETFVKSAAIPPSKKSYISGRLDLLIELPDKTYGVVDLKMVDTKTENLAKFARQLHAYKFALENPADGHKPIAITRLGILAFAPEAVEVRDGNYYFRANPTWQEIPIAMKDFFEFIQQVESLLEGDEPPLNKACQWCEYRS